MPEESEKVTVPVGVPEPGELAVMTAEKVTCSPETIVEVPEDAEIPAEIPVAVFDVLAINVSVDPSKFESPE